MSFIRSVSGYLSGDIQLHISVSALYEFATVIPLQSITCKIFIANIPSR